MTLRLSTGLRDKLLGFQATPKGVIYAALHTSNLAYSDGGGGGGADAITDDGSNLLSDGFAVNDMLYSYQSTTGGNDLSGVACTVAAAGQLDFAAGSLAGSEGFAAETILMSFKGGSLKEIFMDGVIRIYSGSAPSTADASVTGTLLVEISVSSGTFAHGTAANGLEFGAAASGVIAKASGETWSGSAAASGTAGYFRLLGNPADSGALDTALPRIQGSIGTSGADLNMTSTSITSGATYTIDTFQLTLPAYYGA
jgi:hypothetical protein